MTKIMIRSLSLPLASTAFAFGLFASNGLARADETQAVTAAVATTGGEPAAGVRPAKLTLAEADTASAQFVALETKLAQLEQRAQVAEQRAQVAEQGVSASASPPGPVVGADDKGFVLKSNDNAFALKLKGLVAFDGRAYTGDEAAANGDGFLVRKIRPIFEATVLKWADVRFMPDFAGSRLVVVDAFVDIRPATWFKIRAGKFIAPVGLERSEQDTELAFIERSLTSNLTQVRDVGLVAYADIAGGFVHVAAGLINGAPDNANPDLDNNRGKDVTGRLWLQPFKLPSLSQLGALGIGASASTGNHKGSPTDTGLAAFVTPGQTTFFQYLTSATDPAAAVYADGRHTRINPQLFYYVGPFGLLGEYSVTRQRITKGATSTTLSHQAWHGTANFVIGGKPNLTGVTVVDKFDPSAGQFGALELALRVGRIQLDQDTFPTFADPVKSARAALEIGAGASLYFSRNLKIAFNFERTTFTAANVATAALARKNETAILGRTQFVF